MINNEILWRFSWTYDMRSECANIIGRPALTLWSSDYGETINNLRGVLIDASFLAKCAFFEPCSFLRFIGAGHFQSIVVSYQLYALSCITPQLEDFTTTTIAVEEADRVDDLRLINQEDHIVLLFKSLEVWLCTTVNTCFPFTHLSRMSDVSHRKKNGEK